LQLIHFVYLILVPGGRTPTRLPSADFESAFSTVAQPRKQVHADCIKAYTSATCTVRALRMALQVEALNTGAKYHQKYPRKTQRTCVPSLQNLVILRGYFWPVRYRSDRRISGPPHAPNTPLVSANCLVILLVILFNESPCKHGASEVLASAIRRVRADDLNCEPRNSATAQQDCKVQHPGNFDSYSKAAAMRFCSALEIPNLWASMVQPATAISTDSRATSAWAFEIP